MLPARRCEAFSLFNVGKKFNFCNRIRKSVAKLSKRFQFTGSSDKLNLYPSEYSIFWNPDLKLKTSMMIMLPALLILAQLNYSYRSEETSKSSDLPFHPRFAATIVDAKMIKTSRRFPDLASCQDPKDPTPNTVDFGKLKNVHITKVCLFYLFETMSGPEEATYFFVKNGMRISSSRSTQVGGTRARLFGFNSLDAMTKIHLNFKKSEGRPKLGGRYGITSKGRTISVDFFPDNSLASIKIDHYSIFN